MNEIIVERRENKYTIKRINSFRSIFEPTHTTRNGLKIFDKIYKVLEINENEKNARF